MQELLSRTNDEHNQAQPAYGPQRLHVPALTAGCAGPPPRPAHLREHVCEVAAAAEGQLLHHVARRARAGGAAAAVLAQQRAPVRVQVAAHLGRRVAQLQGRGRRRAAAGSGMRVRGAQGLAERKVGSHNMHCLKACSTLPVPARLRWSSPPPSAAAAATGALPIRALPLPAAVTDGPQPR